jgi:ribonuclease P protein component
MPAPAPKRLRLRPAMRLKLGRDFSRARLEGERKVLGCLIANWRLLPAGGQARLGVVTSAKIGGSVVRSRARRLLRETFRLHQHELSQPVDLVLVARHSIARKKRAGVEQDFLVALKQAGLLRK